MEKVLSLVICSILIWTSPGISGYYAFAQGTVAGPQGTGYTGPVNAGISAAAPTFANPVSGLEGFLSVAPGMDLGQALKFGLKAPVFAVNRAALEFSQVAGQRRNSLPDMTSGTPLQTVTRSPLGKDGASPGNGSALPGSLALKSPVTQVGGVKTGDVSGLNIQLGRIFDGSQTALASLAVDLRDAPSMGSLGVNSPARNSHGVSRQASRILAALKVPAAGVSKVLSRGRTSTEDDTEASEQKKPRRSIARSFKVGLVVGMLGLILQIAIPAVAWALGYGPHPNYTGPSGSGLNLPTIVYSAVIMAPACEEILFRGIFQGGLSKLLSWTRGKVLSWARKPEIRKSEVLSFWVPAVITSAVFVLLHETADPLFMGVRMIGSMLMARVFYKEGLMSSIFLHGVHNGLLVSGLVTGVLWESTTTSSGKVVLGVLYAWFLLHVIVGTLLAGWSLRKQKADRKAGRILPYRLTVKSSLVLAGLLGVGMLLFPLSYTGLIVRGGGMMAYLVYAAYLYKRGPPKEDVSRQLI